MVSIFDMFKIGVGPSSSHTVGPMVAGNRFLALLEQYLDKDADGKYYQIQTIRVELFGSLAATGKGHATDTAVLLGLLGHEPASIDTTQTDNYLQPIFKEQMLKLGGKHSIDFNYNTDLIWHYDAVLTYHPNALSITAILTDNSNIRQTYYSIGGGFILDGTEIQTLTEAESTAEDKDQDTDKATPEDKQLPYPFNSAEELQHLCQQNGLTISELILQNELHDKSLQQVENYLDQIWTVMQDCVKQGYAHDGTLPGGLNVRRRAKALHQQLIAESEQPNSQMDKLAAMEWIDLYALAVNEKRKRWQSCDRPNQWSRWHHPRCTTLLS